MTDTKHTPRPWFLVESKTYPPRWWVVTNPETWADRIASCPDYDGIPQLANARLVAAAPDLLEALENVLIALSMGWDLDGVVEKSMDAIAKAKGTGQ